VIGGAKSLGDTNYRERRDNEDTDNDSDIALPLMALGQTAEPQQTQGQTKETQATAPAKGKKMRPAQEPNKPQAKPETGTNVRGHTSVQGSAQDVNRNEPGARSSTSQTNVNQSTKVNVQEFRSRHSEVFSLGRHPKEFFVQRLGRTISG